MMCALLNNGVPLSSQASDMIYVERPDIALRQVKNVSCRVDRCNFIAHRLLPCPGIYDLPSLEIALLVSFLNNQITCKY